MSRTALIEPELKAVTAPPERAWSAPVLWHLLSLDAPAVAALWVWFAARAGHTPITPALPLAMFLAVWILYAADRLLDADELEARHRFHHAHRAPFLVAIALAAGTLLVVMAHTPVPPLYFALAAMMLLWFALVHGLRTTRKLPKEVVTGVIFAAAVFVPELPNHVGALAPFALLCTLNGVYIHRWEHRSGDAVHPLVQRVSRWLPQLTGALILGAALRTPIALAIALAAAGLLALHQLRHRLDPTLLRASADLVLLTPLAVAPFLR